MCIRDRPEAMQGMDADMMGNMPPDAMQGMDAQMMGNMPPDAMQGMDADMMASAPPGVMDAAPDIDAGMEAMGAAFGDQGAGPTGANAPMGSAPPPGPEADPMTGIDAAVGGAMDQTMDQGGGAGAPDMGVPPDAAVEAPMMDDPGAGAPEPDMPPPPPDDPIV